MGPVFGIKTIDFCKIEIQIPAIVIDNARIHYFLTTDKYQKIAFIYNLKIDPFTSCSKFLKRPFPRLY